MKKSAARPFRSGGEKTRFDDFRRPVNLALRVTFDVIYASVPLHVVFLDSDFVISPFSMVAAPVVEATVSSYATRLRGYGRQVAESRLLPEAS